MRPRLPVKTRLEIIRLWVLGHPRDDIARDTNTSSGSVSNTVEEWKEEFDRGEADALRELGKAIRDSGLSPSEYVAGARITNLLTKNGVNIDKAEHFLSGTYKKCEKLGLATDKIVSHIEDLTNLSDDIRLPEIERFIRQKTNEKEQLDKQIHENEENVSNLRCQAEEIEKKQDHAFEMQRKAEEDIILHNQERESLKVAIDEMKRKRRRLTRQNFVLKQENSYAEKLPIFRALELHGVGNQELLTILKAVLNISVSNGIPFGLAVEKFINDIKTQYDSKLGFESKIEDLKCQPSVYQTVNQLYDLGLKNVDILQLGKVYLSVSKKTYSVEDMASGLAKIVDLMSSTTKSGGIQNDRVDGILSNVRERLSQIHFTT